MDFLSTLLSYWPVATLAIIALFFIGATCFSIHTMEAGIVERFSRFQRVATEGLNVKIPFIESLVYVEDLSMQLMDVPVSSKTKDDVTLEVAVRVQYYVLRDRVKEAYYSLDDPEDQIKAHVENVILSFIPKLTLDETYLQEDRIAERIRESLASAMAEFGYAIENALVRNVNPAAKVVAAMNDINAAQREQQAALARGEAQKILAVKEAEAEAEAKRLQGQGIASERKAIIDGLRASVEEFREGTGVRTEEVLSLVLLTQYFDMMKDIGQNSNTILMPHSPDAVSELFGQIRSMVTQGHLAANAAEQS